MVHSRGGFSVRREPDLPRSGVRRAPTSRKRANLQWKLSNCCEPAKRARPQEIDWTKSLDDLPVLSTERRYVYENRAVKALDHTFGVCDAKRRMTIDLRPLGRVNMAAVERMSRNPRIRNYEAARAKASMRQVEFDWIRRPRDGKPGLIVEVNGGQHEEATKRFGGTRAFADRVASDQDKYEWALMNNYIVGHVSNTALGNAKKMCGEPIFRKRMRKLISEMAAEASIVLTLAQQAPDCAGSSRRPREITIVSDFDSDDARAPPEMDVWGNPPEID